MCGKKQRVELPVFYPKEYIEEAHKRGLATIMYLVLAFAVAGLIVLIGKILVN